MFDIKDWVTVSEPNSTRDDASGHVITPIRK